LAELNQWGQTSLSQLVNRAQETRHQLLTLPAVAMFLQQQIAEPLFEAVDGLQHRMLSQISGQAKLLIRSEIVPMTPHQREQAAILRTHPIEVSPAGQEVMIDDADHVEAVSYDACVGEVQPD